jgi:predicted DNA-binding protein
MHGTNDRLTGGYATRVGDSNGRHESAEDAQTRSAVFTHRTDSQVVDIILKMQSDLFHHGLKRAASRRDVTVDEQDLRVLEEHAEAMAREAYREPYDPANNEEHKLRDIEYQRLKSAQPEAELVVSYAQADVTKLEVEISTVQSNMKPPTKAQILMFSAVAGLALTIAPTLHDFVFITMKDDVLNWAVSILSAAIYGVFITWGLLDCDDETGRHSTQNWLGLVGGISVPVGLGILRAANAVGGSEILFAIALTIVELGIVLLLEARARTLRGAYHEWAEQQVLLRDITTRLEAGRANLARTKEELVRIREAIDTHIRLVEELSVRNFNIERITADAIKAVRDGYFQGLAKNRGYLRGLKEVA